MQRMAFSFVTGLVLTVLVVLSLAHMGHTATAQAATPLQEEEPSASIRQQLPVTLSIGVVVETSDAQRVDLPLVLEPDALLALLGEELMPVLLDAGPTLLSGDVQTITVSIPTQFSPIRANLVITPFIEPAPTPTQTSPVFIAIPSLATVNSRANLRTGPGTDFDALTQVEEGQTVIVVARNADGAWYLLQNGAWIVSAVVEGTLPQLPIYVEGGETITESVPATVTSRSLILRAGPSLDDLRLGFYAAGTVVAVTNKSPDAIWVQVVTPDGNTGWMSTVFLDLAVPIEEIPAVLSREELTIGGKVVDEEGEAINGVVVAATQEGATEIVSIDATSTTTGTFSLVLPAGSDGVWTVDAAGIECNSRIIGEECRLDGYYILTPPAVVELPQEEPITIVYAEATTVITGDVVDSDGQPVESGVRLLAEREDGARSFAATSTAGEFALPVAAGVWTVTADERARTTVEIEEDGTSPDRLEIILE